MILWGTVAPREKSWVLETKTPIDMTPWKFSKIAGVGLIILVVAIYASFASLGG